jgi:hypothetical protein
MAWSHDVARFALPLTKLYRGGLARRPLSGF